MKTKRSTFTVISAKGDRKPHPPADSWWTVPVDQFVDAHRRELPRILRNSAKTMPLRMGEPVQP